MSKVDGGFLETKNVMQAKQTQFFFYRSAFVLCSFLPDFEQWSSCKFFSYFRRVCVFTFSENKTVYPVEEKIDLFFRFSLGTRVKMPHYKTNGGEILLFYGEEGGVNDHLKPFLQYVTTFLSVKSREKNMKNSWIHDKLQIVMNQSWGVKILLREKRSQNKHHPKQLPATRHQFFCQVYNSNDFPFPIIIGSSQPQLQCQSSSRVTYGSSLRHGPL